MSILQDTMCAMMKNPKQACISASTGFALLAIATGAAAVGAVAIGAVAVGAFAIGKLSLRHGRIEKLEIGELTVDRLNIRGQIGERERITSNPSSQDAISDTPAAVR